MLLSFSSVISTLLGLIGIGSLGLSQFKKEYESINYGVKFEVDGHMMSVHMAGESNNQTIVFLPGVGMLSPYILYKSFTEPLSKDYRVVTIEPFGYGLSDVVEKERTNENISKEVHQCLEKLGINEYYVMGHSIGGIYWLDYIHRYPNEVLGFIGLDNCPTNHRIEIPKDILKKIKFNIKFAKYHLFRFAPKKFKEENLYLDPDYKYSEEDLKNLDIIFGYMFGNESASDESLRLNDNISALEGKVYPCPALMFIASDNCKALPYWKEGHDNMVGNPMASEVIELESNHMIYTHKEEIIKKINEWIK